MSIVACHNCKRGPGPECAHCKRVDQDDIRISHTPHNRSELQATVPHPSSGKATDLPEDVEATFRQFLFDLLDLSPLEMMILQHFRRGGTPASFRHQFLRFIKSSIKYGERKRKGEWDRLCDEIGASISRATVTAIWNGMKKKMPKLSVFQSWKDGHGGKQADETEEDERRQVQPEFDFNAEG